MDNAFIVIFCILVGLATFIIFKPRKEEDEIVEIPTITDLHFSGNNIFVVKSDNTIEKFEKINA